VNLREKKIKVHADLRGKKGSRRFSRISRRVSRIFSFKRFTLICEKFFCVNLRETFSALNNLISCLLDTKAIKAPFIMILSNSIKKTMYTNLLVFLVYSLFSSSCDTKFSKTDLESSEITLQIDTLATGLEHPWGMAFLPDGRILIAERPGRLRIFENGKLLPDPVKGIPDVWHHGQGGLMEVTLHPNYEENGWIYLGYATRFGNGGNTVISRGKLSGNQFTEVEEIFRPASSARTGVHFGNRIVFDNEGYLFTTIGERGTKENSQTLENHNGKVMRLHDDGRVPSDNPFVGKSDAQPEIWSYGHRNIQGMGFHPETGELWVHEHGPKGGDEINRVKKGANYGWPLATFGINYSGTTITENTSLPGMEDPILQWTPSIAPCGMAFVTSDKYPGWKNNMLVGALAGRHIHRVVIEDNKVTDTEYLLQNFARFRDVRQGPDGYIYVLTEEPGLFIRLVPES
jgi:aldose sugar dehydrogenase